MDVNQIIKFSKFVISEFQKYYKEMKSNMKKYVSENFEKKLALIITDSRSEREIESFLVETTYVFVDEKLGNMDEFINLRDEITKRFSSNFPEYIKNHNLSYSLEEDPNYVSDGIIFAFVRKILMMKVSGVLTDSLLINLSSLLISELNLAKNEFNYYLFLRGIKFSSDIININKEAKITNSKNLKKVLSEIKSTLQNESIFFTNLPILHINNFGYNRIESSSSQISLLYAFYLYKLGEISVSSEYHIKKTVLDDENDIYFFSNKLRNTLKFDEIRIEKNQEKEFVDFIEKISKIISLKLIESKSKQKDKTIVLALERYIWALHDDVDYYRKIMNIIMGLEPLFTTEDERGENSYKVAMRLSKLLKCIGLNSECYNHIKDAYVIRNAVAHGGNIKEHLENNSEEIFCNVLNYLRISLIVFISKHKKKKNELIKLINISMIDEKENEKLKKYLKETLTEFPNSIYDFNKETMWDIEYYYY